MAPNKKSSVWTVFIKIDEKTAKCKLCQKNIKSAGNTTNLMGHIRNIHKATYLEIGQQETKERGKTQVKLNDEEALSVPFSSTSASCQSSQQPSASKEVKSSLADEDEPDESALAESILSIKRKINEQNEGGSNENVIKRQKTITSSFEDMCAFTSSGNKTKRFNNALLFMICTHAKHVFKVVAPQYKLPSISTITRWVDERYDCLSKLYSNKLKEVQNITLTTDIWSDSMQMRSFLGVTAHFGINTEIHSITLGVYELDNRHTLEYISEKILNTCMEWGIEKEKVSAVVTDNAANMVKAIDIAFTKRKHIPCFAHTLNLVVQTVLQYKDLQEIIMKMKAIVTWFKQSCIASDELRKAHPKRN
ncbi:E3 SUMO-protein ligase ZBED1-like [Onthophagus taurus]|uniref:E3 SUMO-protein ligase ZBED1-like n=1 Tax=Onthophagus taurus TaxID=166361 RepID=UPI0039BEAE77